VEIFHAEHRPFEENDIVWIKPYDRKGFISMKLSKGFTVKYLDKDGHEQNVYCVAKLLEHVEE
jgi:hypothetical protein